MQTNQDWSIEWVTFFDEYAGNFHPSFKHKLAKQLFEKGSAETGISGFPKYDFMLLIGQENLQLQQIQEYMFALVAFITPPAFSKPVWICWKAEGVDLAFLHTKDVSNIEVDFHWGGNFPKEEIMPYLKPYKKEKTDKSGLHFDVEYYHNAFPDILLEIVFVKPPGIDQVDSISSAIADFAATWNSNNKDKFINYVSSLTKKDDGVYEVVADMGLDNSIKTIGLLLKTLSEKVQPNAISKIKVK